jgi:hypothetical protein
MSQAPQDVVRFVVFMFITGDVESLDHLFYDRHLNGEIIRHGFAVSLVILEGFVTDGRAFDIKHYSQIYGFFLVHELPEHADEAINGVGGESFRCGEEADGVIRAVDKRIAIYEIELFSLHDVEALRSFYYTPCLQDINLRFVICWGLASKTSVIEHIKVAILISVMSGTSDPLRRAAPAPLHPSQDPPTLHHGLRMEGSRRFS